MSATYFVESHTRRNIRIKRLPSWLKKVDRKFILKSELLENQVSRFINETSNGDLNYTVIKKIRHFARLCRRKNNGIRTKKQCDFRKDDKHFFMTHLGTFITKKSTYAIAIEMIIKDCNEE